jgi:hypothetical protein
MFASSTAMWIATALLAPFWWAVGLFSLAVLGDLSPRSRTPALRLFTWLERTREEPPGPRAAPARFAA